MTNIVSGSFLDSSLRPSCCSIALKMPGAFALVHRIFRPIPRPEIFPTTRSVSRAKSIKKSMQSPTVKNFSRPAIQQLNPKPKTNHLPPACYRLTREINSWPGCSPSSAPPQKGAGSRIDSDSSKNKSAGRVARKTCVAFSVGDHMRQACKSGRTVWVGGLNG